MPTLNSIKTNRLNDIERFVISILEDTKREETATQIYYYKHDKLYFCYDKISSIVIYSCNLIYNELINVNTTNSIIDTSVGKYFEKYTGNFVVFAFRS